MSQVDIGTPPVLVVAPIHKASPWRQLVAILLSVFLGLFLVDAVFSLADSTLLLLFSANILSGIREIVAFFVFFLAILVYILIGVTPLIPKRMFLPLALFNLVATLIALPFSIYFFSRILLLGWIVSLCQVLLGLGTLYLLRNGFKSRWLLVNDADLKTRNFSWWNLSGFLFVNIFVLIPAVMAYLIFCAGLGLNHFTGGFLQLRPAGLTVQVKKYVRDDGKTIQLFPMSHIADAAFYRKVSQAFPSNSIILMEGVTDERNLLTNHITYKRMAHSLGLSEQHEEFEPIHGKLVMADVDVGQFTTNTLSLLNFFMLIHSKGLNAATIVSLMQSPPPPQVLTELFDDLLGKRNEHLLAEIQTHLAETDNIIVPWGVAHMVGISAEIQKQGFHLEETQKYVVIRFGSDESDAKAKHTDIKKE